MATALTRNLRLRLNSNLTSDARYIIYGLVDPRTGQLRYIGQSSRGVERIKSHVRPSSLKNNYPVHSWIKSVLALGEQPIAILLELLDSKESLNEAEQFNIAYFRSLGCQLTNLDLGGGGTCGFRHTEEAKRKMSVARLGKAHSKEWVSNISSSLRAYHASGKLHSSHFLTEDGRKRISENSKRKKNKPNIKSKQVLCITTGEIFSCCSEAADSHGVNAANLSKHLNGAKYYKSIGGRTYQWRTL